MTPDQEGALHRTLHGLSANIGILSHEVRSGFVAAREDIRDLRQRLDRHGKRLRVIEEQGKVDTDPLDITGTHDVRGLFHSVDDLTKKEARRDSMMKFVRRQWIVWVFGLVGVGVAGCTSAAVTVAVHHYGK